MSALTFDRPAPRVRVVPDNLHNQIGYASLLAARDALTAKVRGVGTFIASVTASTMRRARTLGDVLHLRRAGTLAATAGRWTLARAAVPLGMLRRFASPAGVIWALTTATGQRLARTVVRFSLRLLESALMGGTDLLTVGLAKLGRPGRRAAGGIGNASAQLVVAAGRLVDSAHRTLGPWVAANRLPVRVGNGIAGLVFVQQLSALLPPALRVPALVLTIALAVGRGGRAGFARSLGTVGELLAEGARATTMAAGVLAGDGLVRVHVQPTEGTRRPTVVAPDMDQATAEAPMDGAPAGSGGSDAGSRQPGAPGDKRTANKRPGPAGRRR